MSYDGGKGGAGVPQWIINHIPPHPLYVELFLGDGAIMRAKKPAHRSIGVEVNPRVVGERWERHEIQSLTVIIGDALDVLCAGSEWPHDTFIYCDPPYLMGTRSRQQPLYAYEFSEIEQHRALLTLLRAMPCRVAISGYWSELYELELAGWRVDTFNTIKRSGELATEYLWMNYPVPLELHDYRYLGHNYRERERIKRKQQRWQQRLRSMPETERYAMFAALETVRSSIVSSDGVGPQLPPSELAIAAAATLAESDGTCDRELPGCTANIDDRRAHRQNQR